MTVRDLAQVRSGSAEDSASVCIVGAGMAGMVLAHSLARQGVDVLMLESGDWQVDGDAEELNEIDNANGRWTGALRSRCRGIGGTSRRWGGRTIPIAETEAADRPHLGGEGWQFPLSDLDRYTREIETLFALDNSSFEADLFAGEMTVRDPDFRMRWAKWPAFSNCNLANRLHRQVIANPKVKIWTNATVTDFDFRAGRIARITARNGMGGRVIVRADHVVLAGGTVETTRLLLWMQRMPGGEALAGCRSIGRYFQDHLDLKAARLLRHDLRRSNELFGYRFVNGIRRSIHLEFSAETQAKCRVGSAFAYVSMDLEGSALGALKRIGRGLQRGQVEARQLAELPRHGGLLAKSLAWRFGRRRLYVPAEVTMNIEICAEQSPHWDNAITLSDREDRFGVPMARVDWSPRAEDEETLRVAVERLSGFWRRQGWDAIAGLDWLPPVAGGEARLIDATVDYYHPSGTTRMGARGEDSVVSGELTSHHVPNLSVISASVFPRAGSANPTFTLLKMSLRLGDHLGRQMRKAETGKMPELSGARTAELAELRQSGANMRSS